MSAFVDISDVRTIASPASLNQQRPLRKSPYSSSLSIKGSSLSIKSSSVISSPCHCCVAPPTSLGGMRTLLTTWMTPSYAIPSSTVTSLKPLILMLMMRPKRATSTLKNLSSSSVGRSTWKRPLGMDVSSVESCL